MPQRHARLGNVLFRLDPDSISYPFQVDYSVVNTIGGQVIQVLGATTGDLTITASLGVDRKNHLDSWQLAEQFHDRIKQLMDNQTQIKRSTINGNKGGGHYHKPIPFTYHDGVHDWNFLVLVKGISDPDGTGSIGHNVGKISYQFTITLFIVEERSLKLKKIATDKFIERISNGMGWKPSGFNGSTTLDDAIKFIQQHSTDGTFAGYIGKLLGFTDKGGSTSGSSAPGNIPPGSTGPKGSPSLLGPPSVSQEQFQGWWHAARSSPGRSNPDNPEYDSIQQNTIEGLTGYYWEESEAEGVRPDMAAIQMMLETGDWHNSDSLSGNNPSGFNHYDNASSGSYFPTARMGIRATAQRLHQVVSGTNIKFANPNATTVDGSGASNWGGRRIVFWEDMGGPQPGGWATATNYWEALSSMWQSLLSYAKAHGGISEGG